MTSDTTVQLLQWESDPRTDYWATRIDLLGDALRQPQYGGKRVSAQTWSRHTLDRRFPAHCHVDPDGVFCSPDNIIQCLKNDDLLAGFAMIVAWGAMQRRIGSIYPEDLHSIDRILRACSASIRDSQNIRAAWGAMEDTHNGLAWTASPVMPSKCIHFLSRAQGFNANPPVALDGAVIAGVYLRPGNPPSVWPTFINRVRESIQHGDRGLPEDPGEPGRWWNWDGTSWLAGYYRYMTAIVRWAEQRAWTTTEVETTLFSLYG
jgi:hypothetical protein